jgi:hypothetical protein
MLLHEAIAEVLRRNGNRPMHYTEIAAEINRLRLYRKRDGSPVEPRGQVLARMTKEGYSHLFAKTARGYYRLR